ncbi:protein scribble homolog [Austrofundulus limnaeus]|uniref:Protein scribble homolog n=1 Tax=Austrofundulus limnaeus TaxID=52670 RepID=A0A2I4AYC1_AUSLI|nr:PREDICTED: protein scribble homolog [Austrofundulus limnaeus]
MGATPNAMLERRIPHTNPPPRTSSQIRAIPHFSWVANKERLQRGPQMLPANRSARCRCVGVEKSMQNTEPADELQIKLVGQSGRLGISIAGGKGSLPYKDHDEGIFISRVAKGGPSEKAGIHVGDRLMEVNGLSMQGVTHHEAVRALRNAGSCIRLKILRGRPLPPKVCDPRVAQDPPDPTGQQPCGQTAEGPRSKQCQLESAGQCVSKKAEAVTCNGNISLDLERDGRRTVSEPEAEVMKMDSGQGVKHTMTIPRIILTHPSTSDEDVEVLAQIPRRDRLRDLNNPDKQFHSEYTP